MSVVRFRRPTVTHARLIPWEIGVPCIWFRYGDGYEVLSDARVKTPDVLQAISKLGPADRAKLDALIEQTGLNTTRHLSFHSIDQCSSR